jgi:hypothetical protein
MPFRARSFTARAFRPATSSASSPSARAEKGWRLDELDASHNPHITMPDALATLLHEIAHEIEHKRRARP